MGRALVLDLTTIDESVTEIDLTYDNVVSDEVAGTAKGLLPDASLRHFVDFNHEGKFPTNVIVVEYVGDQFKAGSEVYLYWLNGEALSEEQTLVVDSGGFVTFEIGHASTYVISQNKAKQSTGTNPTTPTTTTDTKDTKDTKVPQTGDESNVMVFVVLMMATLAGASVMVVRKRRS